MACFTTTTNPKQSLYDSWNTTLDQLSDPHTAWSGPKQGSLWRYQQERQKKTLLMSRYTRMTQGNGSIIEWQNALGWKGPLEAI